ncbi:hypothetical protein Tco_0989904 [Tanacetum coccineum]|uniref:Uncharacterized protein n=1 Tax=Tanacetum coccineum TaxID=301880 RepID=A0ABQ5EV46_9ASTR
MGIRHAKAPNPLRKKQTVTLKKKRSISADDNIIPKPDVALELGKSISRTEAEEQEEARQVHETHECRVTKKPASEEDSDEPANKLTGRRRTSSIVFRDTSRVSKKKSLDHSQKLKGIQVLTEEEQLAVDTMQAIKASKMVSRSQPHIGSLSKGAGIIPKVPDESTFIFTTSSSNEEMKDVEDDETGKDDAAKADAEKTEEVKGVDTQAGIKVANVDQAKDTIPAPSPALTSKTLVSTVHPSPPSVTAILSVQQQLTPIPTPPTTTKAPPITTIVLDPLPAIVQRVPSTVNEYLGSSLGDSLQKVLQKHTEELKEELKQQESQKSASQIIKIKQEQESKHKWPKHSSTWFDKTVENEYKQKDILFKMMMASKSYEKHPAHKDLYNALIKSLFVDEDDMDQAVAAMGESALLKGKHDNLDEDPTARSDQGKEKKRPRKDTQPSKKSFASKESFKGNTPSKYSKSGKSVTAKEPDEEHVHDMSLDAEENTIDEIGNADEQLDEQTWFNDLVSAEKQPLTFDELMATHIDFSKFSKNRLKLDKITKADMLGRVYNLLKGTCQSSIELEYNMKECYKAQTDRLDWENPEEYFFNNDLEYLKSKDSERKYITSITKMKAVGFGLVVRRADQQKYKFKEGNFVNLHLNDIEDMLLLLVQHKLFHLDGDVIVDLAVALQPYTPSFDPLGVVYEDLSNQKRLMRADKLYKFSDETLKKVRDTLHYRLLNF